MVQILHNNLDQMKKKLQLKCAPRNFPPRRQFLLDLSESLWPDIPTFALTCMPFLLLPRQCSSPKSCRSQIASKHILQIHPKHRCKRLWTLGSGFQLVLEEFWQFLDDNGLGWPPSKQRENRSISFPLHPTQKDPFPCTKQPAADDNCEHQKYLLDGKSLPASAHSRF